MDIQALKIQLAQDILNLDDQELLSDIEKILQQSRAKKYEENLSSFSLQEMNDRIDRAEEEISNGKYKTSEELLKKFK